MVNRLSKETWFLTLTMRIDGESALRAHHPADLSMSQYLKYLENWKKLFRMHGKRQTLNVQSAGRVNVEAMTAKK